MNVETKKRRPCWHCGGTGHELTVNRPGTKLGEPNQFWKQIECDTCLARARLMMTSQDAWDSWDGIYEDTAPRGMPDLELVARAVSVGLAGVVTAIESARKAPLPAKTIKELRGLAEADAEALEEEFRRRRRAREGKPE